MVDLGKRLAFCRVIVLHVPKNRPWNPEEINEPSGPPKSPSEPRGNKWAQTAKVGLGIWQLFGGLAFWSFLGVIRDSREGLLGVQIYRILGFLSIQMCFWGSNSANFADRERPDPFIYRVWGLCTNRFSETRRSAAEPYSLDFGIAYHKITVKLWFWAPWL